LAGKSGFAQAGETGPFGVQARTMKIPPPALPLEEEGEGGDDVSLPLYSRSMKNHF